MTGTLRLFKMYFAISIQLSIIYTIQSADQTGAQACSSCCTAGIPGNPGNHGIPGAPGRDGKGEKGIQGNNGNPGSPGPVGSKGDEGNQGIYGMSGKVGPMGPKGEIGLQGTKGETGEKGEQAIQHKSAFSVAFQSDPGRHPVAPMKYDTVINNIGNHYNKRTGKFVCQYPGTYVFQVTSTKSVSGKMATNIMKNGRLEICAWTDAERNNAASTLVVLELVAGDQVWTQPYSASYNYYHSNANKHCSFSGFLLYAA